MPTEQQDTDLKEHGLGLNEAQVRAARYESGPQIVLAGPGTGKTRVIVARVVDLLTRRAVEPESVLAVTFTNKAAAELSERLAQQIGPDLADRVTACTFHRFGYRVLQRFAAEAGLPSDVELIDSSQRRLLLEELVEQHRLFRSIASAGVDSAIARSIGAMSEMHNAAVSPEKARGFIEARLAELGGEGSSQADAARARLTLFAEQVRLAELFAESCAQRGWLTFDDLIRRPTELIRGAAAVGELVRSGARHLLVDEFQDVNTAQIDLLRALAPPALNPDLTVVGDDDQAIYKFRGADERSFTRFETLWSSSRTVKLETNYRSRQPILDVANSVIVRSRSRFAPDKRVGRPEGEPAGDAAPVEIISLDNQKQSGEAIATAILRMRRGELGAEKGIRLSDIAVICRSNGEAETVRAELEIEGIPALTSRPPSPLDDPGVADLLAWVRLLVSPSDPADLVRLLTRPPIGLAFSEATALRKAYRSAQSRSEVEGSGVEPPGTVVEFLRARGGAAGAEVESFVSIAEDLAGSAGGDFADVTIAKIIRRTGVMGADLAIGAGHSLRVRSLAAVLRFAQDRTPRLEQPRDLAAWWRYYQRLDEGDKKFGSFGEDVVLAEGDETPEGDEAVRVVTAHKSKGLEFDTVFVARVAGPWGFPMRETADDRQLPEGLGANDEAEADPMRHADEERRVFYVACTRAMRQLVLVGMTPKKSDKSYLNELIGGECPVRVRPVSEILAHGTARDELQTEALAFKERERLRAVIDQARTEARREAALALGLAERAEGAAVEDSTREAFERASLKLRCVSQTERDRAVPAWAAQVGLGELAEKLGSALLGETEEPRLEPVPGPLSLSYTSIKAYQNCPRCYYAEYVLGLRERSGVAQLVGTSVHEALQVFYTGWREADSEGSPTPGLDQLQAIARRVFLNKWPADQEVDRKQLVQIESQLDRFWVQHHRESLHITELERAVRLRWPGGDDTHTVRMVIDRVDLADGGERIIDYKTGNPSKSLREVKPDDLQMGLYMLALRQLREDPELTGWCEYWLLASGEVGRIGFDEIKEDKVRAVVDKAIAGILGGRFEQGRDCRGACEILDPA